jgi:hypothetical protein
MVQAGPPQGIYFNGCAWGMAFYVGVCHALEDDFGPGFGRRIDCYGDSAGALTALIVALGLSWTFMERVYLRLAEAMSAHPVTSFRLSDVHNDALDMIFATAEALWSMDRQQLVEQVLRGRLHVGVTEFYAKHHWYQYKNLDDLINGLHGSFHIPIYCRQLAHREGKWLIDGAFTFSPEQDLPSKGAATVTVGVDGPASDSWCDIHPQVGLTRAQCLIQPETSEYRRMKDDGFAAARAWLDSWVQADGQGVLREKQKDKQLATLAAVWPMRAVEEFVMPKYERAKL